MTSPEYRLEYFNLRGRAEPIRWVLAVAEQPYQDVRFDKETEWPKKKSDTPYGKVPVLYVDGRPLSQSVAICRYLGAVHGLSSKDPWLAAVGDEVADSVHDLLPVAAQIVYANTFFCGDELTWVDVFVACYLSQLSSQHKDCLDAAPKVRDLISTVTSKPALKKWLEVRPVTPM
ncbi:probable glutathione S-transferase 7 [Hyalella azteca]|uniref:glutathione transferase n=1 Tax=Hyalella azteca TaxID=294128 RepID=A0A8B7PD30_HYAAZ|nr:probable glutathione S-transferase 7 [Hyalella azteca]